MNDAQPGFDGPRTVAARFLVLYDRTTPGKEVGVSIRTSLRSLRDQRGLSLRALARRSGVDAAALSRYERGLKTPRTDTIETIAAALGVEVDLRPERSANARFIDSLCQVQADAILADPTLLDDARRALSRLNGASASADEWQVLLNAGPRVVAGVLTSTSPAVQALKADSPLAFVVHVSEQQRTELAEAARAS